MNGIINLFLCCITRKRKSYIGTIHISFYSIKYMRAFGAPEEQALPPLAAIPFKSRVNNKH